MWPEELPPGSTVVLGAADDLVHADEVHQMLEHMCGDTVRSVYNPGLFHGAFLVFPDAKRRVVEAIGQLARSAACDSHMLAEAAAHDAAAPLTADGPSDLGEEDLDEQRQQQQQTPATPSSGSCHPSPRSPADAPASRFGSGGLRARFKAFGKKGPLPAASTELAQTSSVLSNLSSSLEDTISAGWERVSSGGSSFDAAEALNNDAAAGEAVLSGAAVAAVGSIERSRGARGRQRRGSGGIVRESLVVSGGGKEGERGSGRLFSSLLMAGRRSRRNSASP